MVLPRWVGSLGIRGCHPATAFSAPDGSSGVALLLCIGVVLTPPVPPWPSSRTCKRPFGWVLYFVRWAFGLGSTLVDSTWPTSACPPVPGVFAGGWLVFLPFPFGFGSVQRVSTTLSTGVGSLDPPAPRDCCVHRSRRSRPPSAAKRSFGWVLVVAVDRSARPGPFASIVCRQAPLRVGLDCSSWPFASGPVPIASIFCR